jgi:hypothetical protein
MFSFSKGVALSGTGKDTRNSALSTGGKERSAEAVSYTHLTLPTN